jgi:hypothetical protein
LLRCYNAAKNYQISKAKEGGWYTDRVTDIQEWDSGTVGGTIWSGQIVGVAEYGINPRDRPVVLKLETGTDTDLYIGFNRATGSNKDNDEADDELTITETGAEGLAYSQSFLKATLRSGETYTHSNWRKYGIDLVVHVNEINTAAVLGYADVTVEFGEYSSSSPTPRPTGVPTSSPTTSSPTQLCGNDVCDVKETADSCPVDCLGRELTTGYTYNSGASGNMFTVEAKRDLTVTSLSMNSSKEGVGTVRVYTRLGSYEGYEGSAKGWNLVYERTDVQQNGRGNVTPLEDFKTGVEIIEGETMSFYVHADDGVVYMRGSTVGTTNAADKSLTFCK